ncbi:8-oxo-dGTP diphosphatase MutT [cyanobacterium endosymbiont of Epithemia clementina EcSB]|uniref:8-oxo-dGTP diphosphatase MutT n=1 Tax=cyanobacterium endosymbiont of Epithemia clementina EcSB TaxID=3034674 RepID=UPI00247FDF79|nr:8-oxo-dGTP diphosphatase MutT [cyanobacterium endosymbiont of Epithemia clementina EcSB]WGT68293.1 8-oxo-dGTP diphosphatase MutT [cyanobacterium endosymbiont of Epithemia clementina EcSB]
MIDLEAIIGTRTHPKCLLYPWRSHYQACHQRIKNQLPMRENPNPLPHKKIGVAVIYNEDGQILIDRRLKKGLLGGLWEFPGGKFEPNETVEDCIKREVLEEIDIEIGVREHLITFEHAYTHFKVTLIVHRCRYLTGEPKLIRCEEIRWVTLDEINSYSFPKANTKIIEVLQNQGQPPKNRT